ncbi:MAG: penicillin-binding protein 2 [Patescibacteria group bacterium]
MSQALRRQTIKRLYVLIFAICLMFFLVALNLFNLQVLHHKKYKNISLNQQDNFLKNPFPHRGNIFLIDKNGKYSAAASTKNGFLAYVNARVLENPEDAFLKLNSVINIDKDIFLKFIQKKNDPFEVLEKKLSKEDAEKILSFNIKGIGVVEDEWRFYPLGAFLSHVLGFSSIISSDIIEGKYGIEKFYNKFLVGSKKSKNSKGFFVFFSAIASVFGENLEDGQDIFLTIEPNVQIIAERDLKKLSDKWHAQSGGILVLDPKSGEVVVMAAFPKFDPNKYFEEKDLSVFLNPFVEKVFEMGSIMKPVTMATGIDSGHITPDTTYLDKGFIEINGKKLRNFDEKPRGERNMTQVLEESLNTGAVFVMQRTGKEIFKEYLKKFGFYEKTNIDLPGEVKSNLSNLESGRDIEFATASFGQGIAVSPIAMVRALGALANGGRLVEPTLTYKNEASRETNEPRQIIKRETAFLVSKMLVDVVDHTLAGGKAKIDGYSIAAKTGTAQIPNKNGGGYGEEFFHSFFGYFPAYDPRFLVFMFLERPTGVKYASQTLTEPFTNLVKFLINYYAVPPDR